MNSSRLLAAVGIVLVLGPLGRAHAFCRLTTEMPIDGGCTSDGIPLWWARSCISFTVMQRAYETPSMRSIRDAASLSFAAWTDAVCNDDNHNPVALKVAQTTLLGECADPEYNSNSGNSNTVIFVVDWAERELPFDAFGLTLVWHNLDTGRIFDADMQINETLGEIAVCDEECPPNAVDLQNVMTHEAGHFLGLGHSPDPAATMASRATIGEMSKRDLNPDDRAGVCSIFGEGEPNCANADYLPENGFSQICSPPELRQACSVPRPGAQPRAGFGFAGTAFLLALAWAARRRRR